VPCHAPPVRIISATVARSRLRRRSWPPVITSFDGERTNSQCAIPSGRSSCAAMNASTGVRVARWTIWPSKKLPAVQ